MLLLDFEEIRNKADAIIEAYSKVEDLLARDDSKTVAVEVPIDETYNLVAVRGGEAMFIVDGVNHDHIVLDYIPDDEWTPGDVIGGYLDLYLVEIM